MSENTGSATPSDIVAQAVDVKAQQVRFTDLKARATAIAYALQATIPVTERSAAAQEAFLLTYNDLQLLEKLLETAQNTLNAFAIAEVDPTAPVEGDVDDLVSGLVEVLGELLEALSDQFGVSNEVVLPAVAKDLVRQLDLVETVVVRAEATVAEITA